MCRHTGTMKMKSKKADSILNFADKTGIIRSCDLKTLGIPRVYLTRLKKQQLLEQVARGLYRKPGYKVSEYHSLVTVSTKNPNAIICLLSALAFHKFTTQSPNAVWIAMDRKAHRPVAGPMKLRVVRFSGKALSTGIEQHTLEGVLVRVYNPAKTVADCFKYRNKIGLDVAIESLKECRRLHIGTNDDLWKYAKICRVWNIMKPYMEALG